MALRGRKIMLQYIRYLPARCATIRTLRIPGSLSCRTSCREHHNTSTKDAFCIDLVQFCNRLGLYQPRRFSYIKLAFGQRQSFSSTTQEPNDQECLVEELYQMLEDNNVVLIDVRNPDELVESGRIEGSVNVPLSELEIALKMPDQLYQSTYGVLKPPEDGRNVVFHCRSGVRSLTALQLARSMGYQRCQHLPGGFLLWKERYGN